MRDLVKKLVPAKFGLILVLFFTPFVNFSCADVMQIPMSGTSLAFGTDMEIKDPFNGKVEKFDVDPAPPFAIAFACAVLGLFVTLWSLPFSRQITIAIGFTGAACLLWAKNTIHEELLRETSGMVTASFSAGFWATFLLFLAAAITAIVLAPEFETSQANTPFSRRSHFWNPGDYD